MVSEKPDRMHLRDTVLPRVEVFLRILYKTGRMPGADTLPNTKVSTFNGIVLRVWDISFFRIPLAGRIPSSSYIDV
jgi:hypothetical protein